MALNPGEPHLPSPFPSGRITNIGNLTTTALGVSRYLGQEKKKRRENHCLKCNTVIFEFFIRDL